MYKRQEYEIHCMIDELLELKEKLGFDTVIVNMYYLDENKNGFGDLYNNCLLYTSDCAPFLLTIPTEKMARSSSFTFLPSRINALVQELSLIHI